MTGLMRIVLLVVVMVGLCARTAHARPMKCDTAQRLVESPFCNPANKKMPTYCEDARKRLTDTACQNVTNTAAVNINAARCSAWCAIESCVRRPRPEWWARLLGRDWSPTECEDTCDTCNSNGQNDGAIHVKKPNVP